MLRLLENEILVVLNCLHHLIYRQILLFCAALEAIDVAAVLVLHFSTLLTESCTLLLPSLLGGKAFSVGGYETIVLLIKPRLALLKAFPLLERSGHVGLNALDLAVELGFDGLEFTGNGILVVTLLLPCRFLGCGLLSFVFWDVSKIVGLESEISGSIVGLTDVLCELKNTLALTLIASSGVGKAVAEVVDLFSNSSNGGLVVLLVSL
jgi:hypothetical protein